ncbi:MAG: gamma-glutamyltransferase family protein [bacterium]|nr:gamma-glutamyltransferase family protein [bacterium]
MKQIRSANMRPALLVTVLLMAFCLSSAILAQVEPGPAASGSNGMVATAHPLASEAGLEILKQGGNAVDAAVASAFAIGVVEPDGSGLGGGGSMVIYLADTKASYNVNYYHQSSSTIEKIKYDPDNDRTTAKSILVPGTVAGLCLAQERFGKLPLAQVIAPAIRYAEQGFPIDGTLAQLILDNVEMLRLDTATALTFLIDGFPKMEGDTLRQPELAKVLRAVAEKGRAGFYEGEIAKAIVERVTSLGGALTMEDLATFSAELNKPVQGSYRGYQIISTGAPQSGMSVIQSLNILENENLTAMGHFSKSASTLHLMAETMCRTYADRWQYLGDPRFNDVPVDGIIAKEYALERFNAINRFKADPKQYRLTEAGNPIRFDHARSSEFSSDKQGGKKRGWDDEMDESKTSAGDWGESIFDSWGGKKSGTTVKKQPKQKSDSSRDTTKEESTEVDDNDSYDGGGSTTHLSVIDKDGNMVALTQTLGTFFGSGVTASGVLMNCGMSNFSLSSEANLVQPNKQPRSSICPTLVLRDGKPAMVVGSPGAGRIICTVVEILVNAIDFDMDARDANWAPRFYCEKFQEHLYLEGGIDEQVSNELERMGHTLRKYEGRDLFFGGVQMILVDPVTGMFYGSADKRRGGVALGY